MGIYRPPYSNKNKMTTNKFLDVFIDYLVEFLPYFKNIVIRGDFNIHMNNNEDPNSQNLNTTFNTCGLKNCVSFGTHIKENILDLVIGEVESDVIITSNGWLS